MGRLLRYRDDGILVGLAVLVRVLYMSAHAKTPYFNQPILDSLWIHQWAVALANGTWHNPDAYFRAPLYPWFVSGVYRLFGASPWVVEVLQHGLGVVTIWLVYRLGRRLFGRSAGFVGAGLLALYPMGPFFEGELLIVTLAAFLGVAFAGALVAAADRPPGRMRSWTLAGAGTLLGLAAAARPNFLILLPLAVLWPWLGAPKRSSTWRSGAWVLAGTLLVVGPIVLRNVAASGDWVPVATQGGLNFYVGNGPGADGRTARAPGAVDPQSSATTRLAYRDNITLAGHALAEADLGRSLRGAEVSRYWMTRTLEHIQAHPVQWARLMFHKTYYLLNNFEISDNRSLREVPFPAMCVVGFGWLVSLGAVGVFQIRRNFRNSSIIVYLTFLYCFSIILFFVNARMRFTIVPLIAILAGAGALALVRTIPIRSRRGGDETRETAVSRTNVVVSWGLFLFVAFLSHTRLYGVTDEAGQAAYLVNRGYLLLEQGECDGALAAYRDAVAEDPTMLEAAYGEARALERCGRLAAARAAFGGVAARWPGFQHGHLGVARLSDALGDSVTAERAYLQAVTASDRDPVALSARAGYLLRHGRVVEAEPLYAELATRTPRELNVWMNYGYTLSALGRRDAAINAWENVINLSTDPAVTALARRRIDEARQGLEDPR